MPADYEAREKSIIAVQASVNIAANATQYFGPGRTSTLINAEFPISENGVLEALYAHSSLAPGVGETYDYTLMRNGIAQAQTCQTAGVVLTDSNDEANPITVVRGDTIVARVVTSLNAAVGGHSVSWRFRKT